ncbi:hypothetical protein NE619_10105 [Anaerovorax odorimutans]|uniref:Uncharacterized protein n=1 Tax=Anaerovorax odorimutans TaxID=109327 RepID=A0ABT1RPF6_9FIRM|nr:hypothetical protein [Anaerovorax odorimutans]MCQ4637078.1 hypothetical protein [Anaerovorax odorimutans]
MSAPIEKLREVAKIPMNDHLAIFDHYVVLGRDLERMAIKFGYDIPVIITILEGYGETVCEESCGRLRHLSQLLVKEYIAHFYPGIASENPQNDWINIEAYLDLRHPGWRGEVQKQKVAEKKRMSRNRGLY